MKGCHQNVHFIQLHKPFQQLQAMLTKKSHQNVENPKKMVVCCRFFGFPIRNATTSEVQNSRAPSSTPTSEGFVFSQSFSYLITKNHGEIIWFKKYIFNSIFRKKKWLYIQSFFYCQFISVGFIDHVIPRPLVGGWIVHWKTTGQTPSRNRGHMEHHKKKILGKPSNCGPLPLSIAEENSNRLFDLCDQLRLGFQATLNICSSLSPPGWYSWKHGNEDPKTLATSFSAPKTLELQHHVQLNRVNENLLGTNTEPQIW